MKLLQSCGMFMVGISDSISLRGLKNIVFFTHPKNKEIHPQCYKIMSTLKNTLIQVLIFFILLPFCFHYLGFELFYMITSIFFLFLTYGYLFFYNSQILTSTKEVALLASNYKKVYIPELDNKEKSQFFYSLSYQVKSVIFMLFFYTPIFLILLVFIKYQPNIGIFCLVISESFFNSTFYFLKKWPYDNYNVGLIEKNFPYMLGYGFFVSLVCNVFLKGFYASAGYFIISQWMIMNCVLYSPPVVQFQSWKHIFEVITKSEVRSKLKNGYNAHRLQVRNSKQYRKKIVQEMFYLKPALLITQFLNRKLSARMNKT